MLKDLTILANRLDSLGLTKEADLLDKVLKIASNNDFELEEYTGEITPLENTDYKKMILEKTNGEIKDIFEAACLDLIQIAKNIFVDKNTPNIGEYLDLLDPRFISVHDKDLIEIFGENKVENFSFTPIEVDPLDLIQAAEDIKSDKSGRYFISEKNKAKNLLITLNKSADKIFKNNII